MMFVVACISMATILGTIHAQADNGKVVTCYYSNWAYYRTGAAKYEVEDIDTDVCSHVIYAFAKLDDSTHKITAFDPWLDLEDGGGLANYRKFTSLKLKKPGLKTLLAIGGWNDSQNGKYSVLVADPLKRKAFVDHVVPFLQKYNFDGLDLDWEYPGYASHGGTPQDKENFAKWVEELGTAFAPHGLLLTAAVGATQGIANNGYDIAKITQYLDYVHLMTYDMHGSWESNADHHSPLYERPSVSDNLNTDYIVKYWINQGSPANKLVVGVPLYGRSFTVRSSAPHVPPAPASGAGNAGSITQAPGFLSYLEICQHINNGWTVVDGTKAIGPYAYNGNQWVGYDDENMAREKAKYALKKDLAGTMVWAMDLADFDNTCGGGRYPLLRAMSDELLSNNNGEQTCKTKKSCSRKGGSCISSKESCDGNSIRKGCKGTNCQCCVPLGVCSASNKCKRRGGSCVSSEQPCQGTLKRRMCKGSTCACCLPAK